MPSIVPKGKLGIARRALASAEKKKFVKSVQKGGKPDWVVARTERQKDLIKRVLRAENKILSEKNSWNLGNDKVGAALLEIYEPRKERTGNTYKNFPDENPEAMYALARTTIKLGKARQSGKSVELTPLEKKILERYSRIKFN